MSQLDDLLQNWAASHEPDAAALSKLQERIVQQCLSGRANEVHSEVVLVDETRWAEKRSAGVPNLQARWSAFAVACALGLTLAALMGWPQLTRQQGSDLEIVDVDRESSSALLLREFDRLFDGRWNWVGEVNDQSHVELDEDRDASTEPRVAVRLVAVERRRGESSWRVIWKASLLTRSQQWVQLPRRLTGEDSVSVWAYALPDGAVMVESSVELRSSLNANVSTGRLFSNNRQGIELWSGNANDREVRLVEWSEIAES